MRATDFKVPTCVYVKFVNAKTQKYVRVPPERRHTLESNRYQGLLVRGSTLLDIAPNQHVRNSNYSLVYGTRSSKFSSPPLQHIPD
jgi:hypothetical protein